MTVRITYVNYKEDVAMSMMRNGEDRTASLKAAVESAGGKELFMALLIKCLKGFTKKLI